MSNATSPEAAPGWASRPPTALVVLADGLVIEGYGLGAVGEAVGEVCFNTAMTGYEEILTDPSYAGQIITFTFPHIGVVGTNEEDVETVNLASAGGARGAILRADVGEPSNWRATRRFDAWLKARGIIAISNLDTRALTARIRRLGMPNAVIAHHPDGAFDRADLLAKARAFPGIDGMDLVPEVGATQRYEWDETSWRLEEGYGKRPGDKYKVVAVDYGIKRNILRLLADQVARSSSSPPPRRPRRSSRSSRTASSCPTAPAIPRKPGVTPTPTIQGILESRRRPSASVSAIRCSASPSAPRR